MTTIPMLSGHGKSRKCASEEITLLKKEAKSTNKNLALGEITGTPSRLELRGEIIRFFQSVPEATIHGVRRSKLLL